MEQHIHTPVHTNSLQTETIRFVQSTVSLFQNKMQTKPKWMTIPVDEHGSAYARVD